MCITKKIQVILHLKQKLNTSSMMQKYEKKKTEESSARWSQENTVNEVLWRENPSPLD